LHIILVTQSDNKALKGEHYMLLDKLNQARAAAGNPSYKSISVKARCSPRTVSRIFTGDTPSPDTCTLENIAIALGTTLGELLSGTSTSIVDVSQIEENTKLKAEIEALNKEVSHLKEIIALKDEIIHLLGASK
jgi:transcriptional regulator with XRE-family HTH domain